MYQVAESFSTSITSSALSLNQAFPNVTLPHFEIKGEKYRTATDILLVSFSPIVTDIEGWNEYALSAQGWISESYQFRGENVTLAPMGEMYYKDESGDHVEEQNGKEEYLPLWMEAPAPLDPSALNFNLKSDTTFAALFAAMRNTVSPVLSPILDPSFLLGDGAILETEDESLHPESLYLQPVFDSFDESMRSIVGTVVSVIPWDLFLKNLLHERGQGITCVLQNTCGGTYSYQIDGRDATYLGAGDKHDPVYNYLEHTFPFGPATNLLDDHAHSNHGSQDFDQHRSDEYCRFTLHVFPTKHLEEGIRTNQPAILTVTIVLIFAFTGMVFILYNYLVEQRQERVQSAAVKSNAIVSSLFPAEVRDRLFQTDTDLEHHPSGSKGSKRLPYDAPKFRLKTYLDDDRKEESESDPSKSAAFPELYETKPIADLFPNTVGSRSKCMTFKKSQ